MVENILKNLYEKPMTFSTFQSKSSTWRDGGEVPYQVHALETQVRILLPPPLVLCRSVTKTALRERMDFVSFNYHWHLSWSMLTGVICGFVICMRITNKTKVKLTQDTETVQVLSAD